MLRKRWRTGLFKQSRTCDLVRPSCVDTQKLQGKFCAPLSLFGPATPACSSPGCGGVFHLDNDHKVISTTGLALSSKIKGHAIRDATCRCSSGKLTGQPSGLGQCASYRENNGVLLGVSLRIWIQTYHECRCFKFPCQRLLSASANGPSLEV